MTGKGVAGVCIAIVCMVIYMNFLLWLLSLQGDVVMGKKKKSVLGDFKLYYEELV